MFIGILLAAGRSVRMGRMKQLLPWPPPPAPGSGRFSERESTTVVAAAFDVISPWCSTTIVVMGHEPELVAQALGSRPYTRVMADPEAPMIGSIKAGLRAAAEAHPASDFLLHPADHPSVRAETVKLLLEMFKADPSRAAMPEHNGKGGHPVVIPSIMAEEILAFEQDGGLREFWLQHPTRCRRIRVDDPGVTLDLDTIEDYTRARGS